MAYFPMYVDIEQNMCIVVGGGNVATGKVVQLLEFGAAVTVIAPEVTKQLKTLAQTGKIIWYPYAFPHISGQILENRKTREPQTILEAQETHNEKTPQSRKEQNAAEMIQSSTLVVAATNVPAVNQYVSMLCKMHRIPVNVVDEKELCTFFFPAIVKRDEVIVSVSTSGSSPALAAKLRRELEMQIPESYGRAAKSLGECRDYVRARVADGKLRKKIFEKLLVYALAEEVLSEELLTAVIEESVQEKEVGTERGGTCSEHLS